MVKCVTKEVMSGFEISPSFLYTLFCIFPFHSSFYQSFSFYLEYVCNQTKPLVTHHSVLCSCHCSSCIHKSIRTEIVLLEFKENSTFVKAWRTDLRQIPLENSNNIISCLIDILVTNILEGKCDEFFSSRLVLECFQVVNREKILDVIEQIWNNHPTNNSLHFLSVILSHCSSLSFSDVLFVLSQITREAQPTSALINLFIHVLFAWIPRWKQDSLDQLKIVIQWMNTCVEKAWNEVPIIVRAIISRSYVPIPFCCSRWCVHLCSDCRQFIFPLQSYLRCYWCETWSIDSFELNSQCNWREGQSDHLCPLCQTDCCIPQRDVDHPYSSCLCSRGIYPLSFNYDCYESSSDESEFEDKRQRIEEFNEYAFRIREQQKWWNHLNLDVFLRVCDFLPVSSLLILEETNHAFQKIVLNEYMWKKRYKALFTEYCCKHSEKYRHKFKGLTLRRLKSMKKCKKNEFLCEYCGCSRRFTNREDYEIHIRDKHIYAV